MRSQTRQLAAQVPGLSRKGRGVINWLHPDRPGDLYRQHPDQLRPTVGLAVGNMPLATLVVASYRTSADTGNVELEPERLGWVVPARKEEPVAIHNTSAIRDFVQ
jgi:hypothetical protein